MYITLECNLQISLLQVLFIYMLMNELGSSGVYAALICDEHRFQGSSFLHEWCLSVSEQIERREWCAKQKDFVLMLRAIADKLSLLFLQQTSASWMALPMMWTRPSISVMMKGTCWTAHALARAGGDGNVILLVSHQRFLLAKVMLRLWRNWFWYGQSSLWIWAQSISVLSHTVAKAEIAQDLLKGKWKGIPSFKDISLGCQMCHRSAVVMDCGTVPLTMRQIVVMEDISTRVGVFGCILVPELLA